MTRPISKYQQAVLQTVPNLYQSSLTQHQQAAQQLQQQFQDLPETQQKACRKMVLASLLQAVHQQTYVNPDQGSLDYQVRHGALLGLQVVYPYLGKQQKKQAQAAVEQQSKTIRYVAKTARQILADWQR